jgi:hypothetical protein
MQAQQQRPATWRASATGAAAFSGILFVATMRRLTSGGTFIRFVQPSTTTDDRQQGPTPLGRDLESNDR